MASLICIPFGLMLGWPCPTYPELLKLTSPIPINIDQSAMIAGFLMIGNTLGTPFSLKTCFGSKYGMTLSIGLMACGWCIMWQARNIYWLLGSRFLVGLANGYGLGQLKTYIREMTEDNTTLLLKQINLHTFFGVIVIFAYGPFVEIKNIASIALIITIIILFLIILLPSTPMELIKANKIKDAKKLLIFLKPEINASSEIHKISQNINIISNEYGFTHIF
ncbi:hypothetical protein NQ314_012030 [Rhamnusium bicolor]|uniref:Uncharacterized protein n=1 Tax=Rhamnusium bicolor TaxID=1586634 RepID=A0AAV8XDT6_9CUCU|nr:hypothetical protein NQ314_012030 [Rhamnusium bicolor]